MQKTRTFTGSTVAIVAALLVLVCVPVLAIEGSTETATTTKPQATMSEEKKAAMAAAAERKRLAQTASTEESGDSNSGLRKEGALLLAEAKKKQKTEKSAEKRQKVCESRKSGLEQKFTRITANSERFQAKIKGVQQKAEDYKTANNVELSNYDELVSAANVAGEASAASITALKEVKPTVDCNNASVASDVATFKAASADTRDKLKAYRTAVKALLKALHDAKVTATDETTETAEGGN